MLRRLVLLVSVLLVPALVAIATAHAAPLADGAGTFSTDDGVVLQYDIAGRGAPAVFVHGGPGSGSAGFQAVAGELFEGDFRMIYLDQRGSGHSASAGNGDYSLERQVEDLEALRRHLKIERWTVVAYSFGGLIAQSYAVKHPDRVRAMIMSNVLLDLGMSMQSSYTHGLAMMPEAARPTFDDAMPFPQRYFTVLGMLQKMGLSWQLQYASEASKRAAEAQVAGRDLGKNRDMGTKIFSGHPGSYFNDLIPSTAEVKVPVLVIDGQDDHVVGPQAERFAYPKMTRITLPGRHNPFIDAPDAYRDAVHAFVKKHRLR